MHKTFTVYRLVKSHLGGAYAHPVKVFDDPKVAEDALKSSASAFAEIAEGTVLVKTPQGPRAVMTVRQLLNELGVAALSHSILEQEVHGAIVLTPTASIIQ